MANHELMECPYNKAHMVTPIKMPYHLMKCRKNFPTTDLVVCPFDATHEVTKAELKFHMLHCPNRVLLEREASSEALHTFLKNTDTPSSKGYTELPRHQNCFRDTSDDQENWDTEVNPSFYLNSRWTRGDSQRDGECILRRPVSHGTAAGLSSSASPGSRQYSMAGPQLDSHLLCLGRGRGRPEFSYPPVQHDEDDHPPMNPSRFLH